MAARGIQQWKIFPRIGHRNAVTFYGDYGAQLQRNVASRTEDIVGLGLSYAQPSRELVADSGRRIASHHEAMLELTYQAPFGDHVSIQPDLQFIFNPGAVRPASTAIVTGVRLNIKF